VIGQGGECSGSLGVFGDTRVTPTTPPRYIGPAAEMTADPRHATQLRRRPQAVRT